MYKQFTSTFVIIYKLSSQVSFKCSYKRSFCLTVILTAIKFRQQLVKGNLKLWISLCIFRLICLLLAFLVHIVLVLSKLALNRQLLYSTAKVALDQFKLKLITAENSEFCFKCLSKLGQKYSRKLQRCLALYCQSLTFSHFSTY